MAYAIFRTAKYKSNEKIGGLMKHHLREEPAKVKGLDPSRTHLNITIGAPDRRALFKAVKARIATATRKPRPDANRVVELVATASPEFFTNKSYEEQKAYLLECVDFAKEQFGAENVVGAYLHFDERTPHAHILCVPLETSIRTTKKMAREITTLNASYYMGGNERMVKWQDDFVQFVQAKGHDLKRGEPKAETQRDHVPIAQYWKEQKREVDAAHVAVVDLLTTACSEAKQAADMRREAERAQQAALVAFGDVEFERQELRHAREGMAEEKADFDEQRQGVQRDRAAVDTEWAKAREARAAAARLEADAERKLSVLDKQINAMERARSASEEAKVRADLATAARDKETADLRKEKAQIIALSKAYQGRLVGLGAVEDVRALVRKPGMVARVEFLEQNPQASEVLDLIKENPYLSGAFIEIAAPHQAVGLVPASWDGSLAQEAEDWLGQEPDHTRAQRDGMDFGM